MKIVIQNVLWLLMFAAYNYLCLAKHDANIAVLLNKEQKNEPFNWDVLSNEEHQPSDDSIIYSQQQETIPETDTFAAAKILCSLTKTGVSVVFGPKHSTTSKTLESICAHLGIPYVLSNWQPQTVSDTVHRTSFNMFPKSEVFSQGLAAVVKSLDWKQFAVLYETEEGLMRLQDVIKLQEFNKNLNNKNKMMVKKLAADVDHRLLLKEIRNASINHIVLDCEAEHIIDILKKGKEVRLVDFSTSFFLTSLDAHTIDYRGLNASINITTIRIFNNSNENFQRIVGEFYPDLTPDTIKTETAVMHDAMVLVAQSMKKAAEAVAKEEKGEVDEDEEGKQDNFEINPFRYIAIKKTILRAD